MGRVKIPLKKIATRQQRNIAFAKRKSGLLKKAYELVILCDIEMVLVFFSPSGKLFLFDAKSRIEETIHKYVNLPCYKRGSLEDEPFIRQMINDMRSESNPSDNFDDLIGYLTPSKNIEDEINECNEELAKVEQQLGYYTKNPSQWESVDEINYQEELLQKTLDLVRSQMKYLEAKSNPSSMPSNTDLEISSED